MERTERAASTSWWRTARRSASTSVCLATACASTTSTIAGNSDESHYKVGILQADGLRDLEADRNSGDAGDPYPGTSGNTSASATTNPSTKSYAGTSVAITSISASGASVTANVSVRSKSLVKDAKDHKELRKELKERMKEKEGRKELLDARAVQRPGVARDIEARLDRPRGGHLRRRRTGLGCARRPGRSGPTVYTRGAAPRAVWSGQRRAARCRAGATHGGR